MLIWHRSIIFDTSNKSHKSQIVTSLVSFHCLSITCQKWWEKKEITAACFESCVLLQCCWSAAVLYFFSLFTHPFWQVIDSLPLFTHQTWQVIDSWNFKIETFGQKSHPDPKNKDKILDGQTLNLDCADPDFWFEVHLKVDYFIKRKGISKFKYCRPNTYFVHNYY